MAFIVFSRFSVTGRCGSAINAQITVKTRGSLKQKHVHFISKDEEGQAVVNLLKEYPIIAQTLEELDFNYFHLVIKDGVWHCEIEPFTASEMVCRMPAIRRYLRLTPEQRHSILICWDAKLTVKW